MKKCAGNLLDPNTIWWVFIYKCICMCANLRGAQLAMVTFVVCWSAWCTTCHSHLCRDNYTVDPKTSHPRCLAQETRIHDLQLLQHRNNQSTWSNLVTKSIWNPRWSLGFIKVLIHTWHKVKMIQYNVLVIHHLGIIKVLCIKMDIILTIFTNHPLYIILIFETNFNK